MHLAELAELAVNPRIRPIFKPGRVLRPINPLSARRVSPGRDTRAEIPATWPRYSAELERDTRDQAPGRDLVDLAEILATRSIDSAWS